MEKKLCGAKTRKGTPCQKAALANGRCNNHGGKSTEPKNPKKLKGNKNALKHGLYETIWLDTLTEEEQELFAQVSTDLTTQVENRFKLSEDTHTAHDEPDKSRATEEKAEPCCHPSH